MVESRPDGSPSVVQFVRPRAPRVVIGMPIYNGAGPHLASALDGILMQNYPNCAIVVSDNASTDDSLAFVRTRCGNDGRVSIRVRQSTCSASAHFNEVLALAPDSDFFMYAADDDVFHPTYVAECVELFAKHSGAVSAGSAIRLIDAAGCTVRIEPNIHSIGMDFTARAREIARRAGWYSFYNLMRRDIIEGLVPFTSEFGADVLFVMKLLLRGDLVATDDALFAFRMPAQTLTPQEYLDKADAGVEASKKSLTELFRRIVTVLRESDIDVDERERAGAAVAATIGRDNGWLRDAIAAEHDLPEGALDGAMLDRLLLCALP